VAGAKVTFSEADVLELIAFIAIGVATVLVWRSHWFHEYTRTNLPPLIKYGLGAQCRGAFVKADDPGQVSPEWFHPRTLILGYNKRNERAPGEAVFLFELPRNVFSRDGDVDAWLMVEAERVHGGLHSHLGPKQRKATIEVNGETTDEFWLIDRMPNSEDFGYRNVGPIPIDNAMLRGATLRVELKIENLCTFRNFPTPTPPATYAAGTTSFVSSTATGTIGGRSVIPSASRRACAGVRPASR
jgi:hypothetical protein